MSVSAPRMTIRRHLPWPLRAVIFTALIALGGVLAKWAYDIDVRLHEHLPAGTSSGRMEELTGQVKALSEERDRLVSAADAAESQLSIERASGAQLATQVKALESGNAKLKEDLAFFEKLLPTNIGARGISIQKLHANMTTPSQLHYQMLAVQGGKGSGEFVGNLQLVLTVIQNGKSAMITFPEANTADAAQYRLSFRYYQRLDGALTLPQGAVVKAIQARVLEKGQIRAQESENL
ncbi:hypothetical protein QN374_07135 [Herbaspirillum sp. RTI4]|nr:hypothetical protein [Herbaspirillum sp. RTI4]